MICDVYVGRYKFSSTDYLKNLYLMLHGVKGKTYGKKLSKTFDNHIVVN